MKNLTRLTPVLLIGLLFLLGACAWLFPKDDENPVIQISSPTNYFSYATTQETIDLAGTAFDNKEIKSITIKVNDAAAVEATGTTNWSLTDIALQMGENTIVCEAKDKKGNTGTATFYVMRNTDVEFTGHPYFSQSSFFANQTGYTVVRQTLTSTTRGITNVAVAKLDSTFAVVDEIGSLYDDGDLYSHYDEIQNDNVWSGYPGILETMAGDRYYRIVAYSDAKVANYSPLYKVTIHETITQTQVDEMIDNHAAISAALNATDANTLEEGAQELKTWFEDQPGVTKAEIVDGYLEVTYSSGIKGGVIFSETDEDGYITTLGAPVGNTRPRGPSIPLNKQTRGIAPDPRVLPVGAADPKEEDEDVIQDKDVLIWQPFTQQLSASSNVLPGLTTIFNESDLGLNVVSLSAGECTIASLNNIHEYGTVIMYTHGVGGEHILTRELMTDDNIWDYILPILNDEIGFFENVTYSTAGGFAQKGTVYSVRSAWIQNLPGTMPNSVVFNSSCESFKVNNLRNAFSAKGANAYLGFSKIVGATWARDRVLEYFRRLAVQLKNNGEAFIAGQTDPGHYHAAYSMWGRDGLHYTYDLINGDFEFGNLNGWFREGDGRVITQLGDQAPTQGSYMGIISTGLGFTTSSGSISQPFRVPDSVNNLSIKWNFISEEFMEWVGSQYQDYLTFALVDSTGATHTLFHETIDSFVGYGLTNCTPPISFDQGGCYMTGWRQFVADISAYHGQIVRLRISAGDVGDSIYDSACLLDEITIY
ncbi:MAG: Ig-like domain-containing protein [Candidatus Cloacimonetes bacterium]|nr:Ig-like domain-containing protein [Candidatus Cloacimonadota bacterium]